MKKSIFIVGFFMGIGIGFINHFNAQNGDLSFNNYNSTNTNNGITSNQATSVAFDNDGNVAYTAQASNGEQGNGLTIGIKKKGGTFKFVNYSGAGKDDGFHSDNGQDVAFDNNGNIAYVSNDTVDNVGSGIVFGIKNTDANGLFSYTFKDFTTDSDGNTMSNKGIGIAFDGNGDIAYATNDDGIFIGTKGNNSEYSFRHIMIGDHTIQSISMDNKGDIAFSSKDQGPDSSYEYGGLNVCTKESDDSYTLRNYKPWFNEHPCSYSCALSKDGKNVAYTVQSSTDEDEGGDLGAGEIQPDGIFSNFAYYGKHEGYTSGISNGLGQYVTFNDSNDIGYTTKNDDKSQTGGGLNIGKKHVNEHHDIIYSFNQYNTENTTGITNNYGTSAAFDNSGNIGYTSQGGGLSITSDSSNINSLTVGIDSNTIMYEKEVK